MPVEFRVADPFGEDAQRLTAALSDELAAMYPEDKAAGAGSFRPEDVAGPEGRFLIAYVGGEPAGCAAVRLMEPGVAEFKRLYVVRAKRGEGIARALIVEFESQARELGYRIVRLETGLRQANVLHLVASLGYQRIANYGIYVGNPFSACFEKDLV
jgi:GNAT superfamily N-acetyltransferase